ncbi:MAG: hypothetical protein AAF467_18605 [Actinomycetota bacterium]
MTALDPRPEMDLDGAPSRREPIPLYDADDHGRVELPPLLPWHRRIWATKRLMHHNRLAVTMLAINAALAVYAIGPGGWFQGDIALEAVANVAIVNLTVAIGIRQQHVINLLFRVATAAPTSWPLSIRRVLGKVYHFGGVHVGGAIAGSLWFVVLLGSLGWHAATDRPGVSTGLIVVAAGLAALLGALIGFSIPTFRAAHHDLFERMHRFGGWMSLALFWVFTILFIDAGRGSTALGTAVGSSLGVWLLALVTLSVALPWMRLKKVPVDIERPSDHVALARFDYGETPFAGSSTTLSRNPLLEWHSFANVPSPDRSGFRLTISRAGDWTGQFIDDMPSHVWVKGITTAGVGNVDRLFTRVVWVATGSGIGPTLPHLLAQEVPAHLVWATRDPWTTYGQGLVDEILDVEPNATFWDTTAKGKPDMVKLTWQAVQAFDAEAVICISNKTLTWKVVEGMERRGIPAYGAIWDS